MEGQGNHQTTFGGLDDAVVIQDEIARRLPHPHRRTPGGRLVRGGAHDDVTVEPAVLLEVEDGNRPALQPEQRDAHDVTAAMVLDGDLGLGPRETGVAGFDGEQTGRPVIGPAASEISRVDEKDPSVLELDERALGVPGIVLARVELENGPALRVLERGLVERAERQRGQKAEQ